MEFTKVNNDGTGVPSESRGFVNSGEILTADTTQLRIEDSGKVFMLDIGGGNINLPTGLVYGVNYEFELNVANTSDWLIISSTNIIQGYVSVNYATIPASNESTITFANGSAIAGDKFRLFCDGTSWILNGVGSAAGAITATAP
jgi:hypothetical protein|tara:strand:+ start:160 stop:591 length:432 start_codon:yes stop_codon:yes gene_type:complete